MQYAHFLMYRGCNDASYIDELRYVENVGDKVCDVTYKLLVKGKGCDETAFHKMCHVTHNLLVI